MKYNYNVNDSFLSTMESEVHEVEPSLACPVNECNMRPAESDISNTISSRMEDQMLIMLKSGVKLKKRCRGKRKPKRKENRRRARPGKSRSGFVAIGAPFNNNEFLINQRDAIGMDRKQKKCTAATLLTHDLDSGSKEQNCFHHDIDQDATTSGTTCSETIQAKNIKGQCFSPDTTSSGSIETSDYESLHSPSESSSGCSNYLESEFPQDNSLNDEMFDIDFALQNFEADYSAHQWELKEQLITLPRQQLESKCSMLMDQVKDLEERIQNRGVMHGMIRVQELELELEALRKENRRLRGISADSPSE